MKVKFRRMFFGPDAKRYKAGEVHDVPDDWRGTGILPAGAEILNPDIPSEEETDDALNKRSARARNISAAAAETPLRRVVPGRSPDAEARIGRDGVERPADEPDPTAREIQLNQRARQAAFETAEAEEVAARKGDFKEEMKDKVLGPAPTTSVLTPPPPAAPARRAEVRKSLLGVDPGKDLDKPQDVRDIDQDVDVDNLDDAEKVTGTAEERKAASEAKARGEAAAQPKAQPAPAPRTISVPPKPAPKAPPPRK